MPLPHDNRGLTLAELLIGAALLGLFFLAVVPFITLSQRGFTSMEVQNSLKSGGQRVINRVQYDLIESKRLFQRSEDFLSRVPVPTAGIPAPLTGSRLPVIEPSASLSPTNPSFVASSVGNSLFFASVEAPVVVTVAPGPAAGDYRIDTHIFNYYYPALDPAMPSVAGNPARALWEWHSMPYADRQQLANIAITRGVGAEAAVAAGLWTRGVQWAWQPSATSADGAFFSLDAAGAITLVPTHILRVSPDTRRTPRNMLAKIIVRGSSTGGYRYSISPNTSVTRHPVPRFAAASVDFPSGFEVVTVGPAGGRQVLVRMVLAAEGSFRGVLSDEQVAVVTARDIW